ncbi:MAG: sigma-70 family RNA polymerase sigma factor [Oscillospiraceae bacterium]|nr:sigma-70 family RNA polymerase sigma factor [Oscillospiraceae bacterium]
MEKKYIPDFAQTVEKYSDNIYRIALVHTSNESDAKDVVQDTFLKYVTYLKKGGTFNSDEHEKAWLIRVTLNRCTDLKRSWVSKSSEISDEILPPVEFRSSDNDVLDAVNKLPEKYKNVIHLFYFEDYSLNEICVILKMNLNTVKTNLSRGRSILRKSLGEEFRYEY